ncbi:curli production assembly/transport component CsgF [Fibrella aquatilis]|uniref:Curli production assembly/transport component CsgF n=1 Tax=Fibrella aquatilis TaxID=2817059 RepID=A0A939GD61_9BACT|nr:curli production assembly/transport component CsgF [Fibrella aquatilis]MBO0934665.1 curli assembly protein CsgF [Fibrella aquatilis]
MKKLLPVLVGLMSLLALSARGQALVYRPNNPAFGGNTFNYQWMLSSAQAQDKTKDPSQKTANGLNGGRTTASSLDDFSASLQRQLLSRITSNLLNKQFGETSLKEGTYQFGDFQVTITNATDGVLIRIVDGKGGETTVTVPYY